MVASARAKSSNSAVRDVQFSRGDVKVKDGATRASPAVHAGPSQSHSERNRRPVSAQPRVKLVKAASLAPRTGAETESVLRHVKEKCRELKEVANHAVQEKKLLSTRQMALDRELQRRERLLRTMVQLQNAGQGLGIDLIEKLREERNMLPIYRKKLQELEDAAAARDVEIRNLKHDEKFTHIIELQVEYASWQHECRRLQYLLEDMAAHDGSALQKEVEVLSTRAEGLKEQLEEDRAKQENVEAEMIIAKGRLDSTYKRYEGVRQQLASEHETTEGVAATLQEFIAKRREVDQANSDVSDLKRYRDKVSAELDSLSAKVADLERQQGMVKKPHQQISESVFLCETPAMGSTRGWKALRCAAAFGFDSPRGALLSRFLALDEEKDGILPLQQIVDEFIAVAGDCQAARDLAASSCLDVVSVQHTRDDGSKCVRWLDALVALDRLGGNVGRRAKPQKLPCTRTLRSACLRKPCHIEELISGLEGLADQAAAVDFFHTLGLDDNSLNEWVEAWWALGSAHLLARLPLSVASTTSSARTAWMERCKFAVRQERDELQDVFSQFPYMVIKEEQFAPICTGVLSTCLTPEDIDDLGLWARGPPGDRGLVEVDGNIILSLSQS